MPADAPCRWFWGDRRASQSSLKIQWLGLLHFHAYGSAAPLKLGLSQSYSRRTRAFPRSSERGPIEAFKEVVYLAPTAHFRAHRSAAPLKRYLPIYLMVKVRVPQFFVQSESEKSGFMGRRSVRAVEQIPWVERSPEQSEDDSRYSTRAKLRSCAWRRQGKGTS